MSMSLNSVFQNAANVSTDRAATTKVYINTSGNVSNTSGLNWFARNFQASSQQREHRITLGHFRLALERSPKYQDLVKDNAYITSFFQDKLDKGTPLTAADVRLIESKLETLYKQQAARVFQQQQVWPPEMVDTFSLFCLEADMRLDTAPEIAAAFKAFAASPHGTTLANNVLHTLGVPAEQLPAALKLLQNSPAWRATLDSAFTPGANFTDGSVLQALQNALNPWAEAVTAALQDPTVSEYLKNNPKEGSDLLTGMGEMVRNKTLPPADAAGLCKTCIAKGFSLKTPASKHAAVTHLWKEQLATGMLQTAIGEEFPLALGQALAKSPQFQRMLEKEVYTHFPPPVIPTPEAFTTFMNNVTTAFWTAQKDHIQKLFDFANHPQEQLQKLPPALQTLVGGWSEERICQLLPLLLNMDALLDHLLVPENRADATYLKLMAEFQGIVADHGADTAQNILALLFGARGLNEGTLGTLLGTITARTKELDPSLHALDKELSANTRKVNNTTTQPQAQANIANMRNALQSLARFAYAATTPAQHAEHNVGDNADQFVKSIIVPKEAEVQPNPMLHQGVTNWGVSIGINILDRVQTENEASFEKEIKRLCGAEEYLASTEGSKELLQECAAELGIPDFDTNIVFDATVYDDIDVRVRYAEDKILTEQEVRDISKEAFLTHMSKLKVSLEYIRGLPKKEDPVGSGAFYMTPEEKQVMLKHMAYHSVRDEALIRAAVLAARTMKDAVGVFASAQSTPEERYRALRQIAAAYLDSISILPEAEEDLNAHFTLNLALAVAVDANGLSQEAKKTLHDFLAGEDCEKFGNAITTLRTDFKIQSTPAAEREYGIMEVAIRGMDKLRTTLAIDLDIATGQNGMAYTESLPHSEIPPYIWGNSFPGETRTLNIQANIAMSAISPPLTEAQWQDLRPVLLLASSGTGNPFDSETSMRFIAAHAHKILQNMAAHPNQPMTPARLWRAIFDQRPGWFLNENNFADRMYTKAMKTLYTRAKVINPGMGSFAEMQGPLRTALSQGVPLADICRDCRPGGTITLDNLKFTKPAMRPVPVMSAENTYGLADVWQHKKKNAYGELPTLSIALPNTEPKNYKQNPDFADEKNFGHKTLHTIVEDCKALCHENEVQLKRVLQCLSPDAVEPLCKLTELLPGAVPPLPKDAYMNCSLKQEGENVQVHLSTLGPPWGADIYITVAPNGTATYTQAQLRLRG